MSEPLEALKHFTTIIAPDPFDERDVSASWIRKQWAEHEPVIRAALEQPSTAEIRAKVLEEFAKKMRQDAKKTTLAFEKSTEGVKPQIVAAEQAEAEAQRIREEG